MNCTSKLSLSNFVIMMKNNCILENYLYCFDIDRNKNKEKVWACVPVCVGEYFHLRLTEFLELTYCALQSK